MSCTLISLLYTHVYSHSLVFIHAHSCSLVFTVVCSFTPIYTPMYTHVQSMCALTVIIVALAVAVQLCALAVVVTYSCTVIYSGVHFNNLVFTLVHLYIHVCLYIWLIIIPYCYTTTGRNHNFLGWEIPRNA